MIAPTAIRLPTGVHRTTRPTHSTFTSLSAPSVLAGMQIENSMVEPTG